MCGRRQGNWESLLDSFLDTENSAVFLSLKDLESNFWGKILKLLLEDKMVCVSEIQTKQHEAVSCLFPTYGINLRIDVNKIPEPRWRRLETQKHEPWNNSLLPTQVKAGWNFAT